MKSEAAPPRLIDSSNLPRDTRVKVTLIARPMLTLLCKYEDDASWAERVFILEH
jgi:hypothetical protein